MNNTQWIRHLRQIAVVVSMIGLSTTALAVPDAPFQSAFAHFLKANAGDAAAIEPAAESFTALLQTEPSNPVLMAYAGAATAMKATSTWLPWKKMAFAEDGLSQLDKALAMLNPKHDAPVQHDTPGVLEVKFVAANTFLAVPGFMNRHDRGTKLLGDVLNSPLLDSAPLEFKGSVWLKAAAVAIDTKNTAEARRYLDLIVQRNAPQAAHAQSLRKGLSS